MCFILYVSASKPEEKEEKEEKDGKEEATKAKEKEAKDWCGQLTGYKHSQQKTIWKVMQLSARATSRLGLMVPYLGNCSILLCRSWCR